MTIFITKNLFANELEQLSFRLDRSSLGQAAFFQGFSLSHFIVSKEKKILSKNIFFNQSNIDSTKNMGAAYGVGQYLNLELPLQLYISLSACLNIQKSNGLKLSLGPSLSLGAMIHLHDRLYFQSEIEQVFLNKKNNYDAFNFKVGASIIMKKNKKRSSLHVKLINKKTEKISYDK